jgi:hypothetical protein
MATGGIALNGTSQYLEFNDKILSALPGSLIIWGTYSTNQAMMSLVQQQSNADRYIAAWLDANGTSKYAQHRNPGAGDSATRVASPDPGATLRMHAAIFNSTTLRGCAYGSNSITTSTGSATDDLSSHDRITVGAWHYNSGSAGLFHAGTVCEVHFFNVALTSSDLTTLLTPPPEQVAGWVDGWILDAAENLTSIGGSRTLTAIGSPTTGSVTLPYTRSGGGASVKRAMLMGIG